MEPTDKEKRASDYRLSRAALLTEGFKGLLLINGGGAAALLTFVAAIWDKAPDLAGPSLHAIVFMAAGLSFALLVPFFRYHHSKRVQPLEEKGQKEDLKTRFWYLYQWCQYLSIFAFLAGFIYLVCRALPLLPHPKQSESPLPTPRNVTPIVMPAPSTSTTPTPP